MSLDQMNSLIKTLGISVANLYGKTRNVNPDSPAGITAYEDLCDNLRSLGALANQMAFILEAN